MNERLEMEVTQVHNDLHKFIMACNDRYKQGWTRVGTMQIVTFESVEDNFERMINSVYIQQWERTY